MTDSKVLICDDEELVRWSLREHLTGAGFDVVEAQDGETFLEEVGRSAPSLAILDLMLPGIDGLTCLRRLREAGNELPVIMLTAVGSAAQIVEATRLGAATYITKPFELSEIEAAVRLALKNHHAAHHVADGDADGPPTYAGMIGGAPAMGQLFDKLRELETADPTSVLISGESGTGKDLVAQAIHNEGVRRRGPFVEVDCTAIPEALMESTLFGHERGAFTDAKAQRKGLLEEAADGVVFLDEIGELPMTLQAKLLRALENRTFKRVGSNQNLKMSASVVAATNRSLLDEVEQGRFRKDLFYRLAVVELHVPALRQRREDVPRLVRHFITKRTSELGRADVGVTEEAMASLSQYGWPGNVRELRNAVERLLIFHQEGAIGLDELPSSIRYATGDTENGCPFTLPESGISLEAVERGFVIQALDREKGNQTAAAKLLGVSRYALRTRMKKYGIT